MNSLKTTIIKLASQPTLPAGHLLKDVDYFKLYEASKIDCNTLKITDDAGKELFISRSCLKRYFVVIPE